MKKLLIKVGTWLFLGKHTLKKSLKTESILRVITLNLIILLESIYLIAFFPAFNAIGMPLLFYAALLLVFASAFILVHTRKGIEHFDYIKTTVILSILLFYGMLYANTEYGHIWTFLLPLMIIFVMELRWGASLCLLYYIFMVSVEFRTSKFGWEIFMRHTCIFWAQVAIIAAYETFRNIARNRLIKDKEVIKHISNTDHLTKLYNRRYFSESIEREFAKAMDQKENICFLMIDADHFKKYNDTYGHLQGDEMLVSIAGILKKVLRRSGDLVFRMGGEEFGILLPNTNYDWALSFAEKIRAKVEDETKMTVSVGMASISPQAGQSSEILLKQADNNLYKAKDMGRNRVVG